MTIYDRIVELREQVDTTARVGMSMSIRYGPAWTGSSAREWWEARFTQATTDLRDTRALMHELATIRAGAR